MENKTIPGYGDAVRASVWLIDGNLIQHYHRCHNFPASVTLAEAKCRLATQYNHNHKIVWSFYDSDTATQTEEA